MCQTIVTTADANDTDETITMTIEQLEELIEAVTPSGANLLAGLSRHAEPTAGTLWEKCTRCVKGFKVCLKCGWTGCKVRVRRC